MLVSILSTALAASFTTQTQPSSEPIVVIGQRIRDAQARLKACLDRNCPPDEDIDATLALAETQIIAGKYRDARATLLKSLGRNHDEAKRYPIPVSDLWRSNGKVAAHLGLDGDYYRSTWGIYRALKEGIPDKTSLHFSAQMEIAEMVYRTRGHERARLYYADIADEARKAGRPDIAALAELRSIVRHLPPDMREPRIRKIAASTDPQTRAARLEATLALARMAYERDDTRGGDDLLKQFAQFNIKRPILIYAPPYEMVERDRSSQSLVTTNFSAPFTEAELAAQADRLGMGVGVPRTGSRGFGAGQFSTMNRMAGNFDDMWLDVQFTITSVGTVSDVKVVRSVGDIFWAKPLLASIKGRRYTPAPADSAGSRRLERYTYTSGYDGYSGTRVADRTPQGRVEFIDLSGTGGLSAATE